jgi:uncharacterized protein YdeI (BOF family)
MKHLILAAGLTLIAAPAFADGQHDARGTVQQQAAMATAQQKHSYTYSDSEGSGSAIETRNNRLERNAQERSPNAKAAWRGSVHYY